MGFFFVTIYVLFNLEYHYFSLSSESAFEGELGYLQVTISLVWLLIQPLDFFYVTVE